MWPKYWSFSFSISPSSEYSELISFRIDWFNLLAVQETHKSLLQHHSSKASILRHSAFLTVQLSHPYMTTGKTIALLNRKYFPLALGSCSISRASTSHRALSRACCPPFAGSPAAEQLQDILGEEDEAPNPTLFTEMDTLQHDGDQMEWKESAR